MLVFAQVSLLLGLGALIGCLLAYRFVRREFDQINRRLDTLRDEIHQLPAIEVQSPVDLTPITTMIELLEHRVAGLPGRLTETLARADVSKGEPRVLGTALFRDKDDQPT